MNAIVALLFVAAVVFCAVLFGTVMGAIAGAIVGFVFDETTNALLKRLALDVEPWQLGAMLGFVGGFFRGSTNVENKK